MDNFFLGFGYELLKIAKEKSFKTTPGQERRYAKGRVTAPAIGAGLAGTALGALLTRRLSGALVGGALGGAAGILGKGGSRGEAEAIGRYQKSKGKK